MSLTNEIKIRILENFYAIDYILFGKPFKSLKLNENECELCNSILKEEYLSEKGAIISTVIEMYKIIDVNPVKLESKVSPKQLNKMAMESAKIARKNSTNILQSNKGRQLIKNKLIKTITENETIDVKNLVENNILESAFSMAIDNLLISRCVNESNKFDEMNSWSGRIVEDAYKILRTGLVETAMEIRDNIIGKKKDKE